jgi:hypothetical protein
MDPVLPAVLRKESFKLVKDNKVQRQSAWLGNHR